MDRADALATPGRVVVDHGLIDATMVLEAMTGGPAVARLNRIRTSSPVPLTLL